MSFRFDYKCMYRYIFVNVRVNQKFRKYMFAKNIYIQIKQIQREKDRYKQRGRKKKNGRNIYKRQINIIPCKTINITTAT